MLMFQPVGGMDRIPRALADADQGSHPLRGRGGRHRQHARRRGGHLRRGGRGPPGRRGLLRVHHPADDPREDPQRLHAGSPAGSCRIAPGLDREGRARVPAPVLGRGRPHLRRHHRTRTWTSARSGTHRTATLASAVSSSAPTTSSTTPMHSRRMTPEAREARALEQGRKVHGDAYVNEFVSSFSASWRRMPFSEGGWVAWERTDGCGRRGLRPPAGATGPGLPRG